MEVVIIGTGNVAYGLGRKIKSSAHRLVQVVGRTSSHASRIGEALDVSFSVIKDSMNKKADLYIVAIADDALPGIGNWLSLDRKLIVHTAGSVSKDVLQPVSKNYGVLYPLQSMNYGAEVLPEIPFLVDGNTPDDLALIHDFATSISEKVEVANDEARLKLHVAAVVVNNFSNHLYSLAERFCIQEKLPFHLLQPLIRETANRISLISPKDAQTGPAARNDTSTISKQMEILRSYPELKKIYKMITESIRSAGTL
jgi:predicted short-subunit dehydrogenase-like oxidoreductase (DUF2520 family)